MSSVIIGHSQVKYVKNYLTDDSVTCLCFPENTIDDFINEECILDIVPSFSVVVLVVGANDVVNSNPTSILRDISELCHLIHRSNPSANVVLTNILPRGQNHFHGRRLPAAFLQRYNQEAREVNKLLKPRNCRKVFAGFQFTEKVPVFLEDESQWNIGSVMLPVNEDNCVQIHHTGKDHWVTSLKFNNAVHLIDSLGTDRPENAILTQSLKIQLSQIYGKMCKNSTNSKNTTSK